MSESRSKTPSYTKGMSVEVVLRDFDGSRTIFPTELPLRPILQNTETDLGVAEGKLYVKTDETDDHGRAVYVEQR